MREVARTFIGSCVVYAVVASCGVDSGGAPSGPLAGSGASEGTTGGTDPSNAGGMLGAGAALALAGGTVGAPGVDASMGTGGDNLAGATGAGGDSLIDAMLNPVPDANAQEMSGSRLQARYIVGDDGSRQFFGWFDTQRSELCTFSNHGGGDWRCLPQFGLLNVSHYSDDACTQPLMMNYGCQPPGYVATWVVSSCGASGAPARFHQVQERYQGTVYFGAPSSCSEPATDPCTPYGDDCAFYRLGPEIPRTAFVGGTVQ